MMMKISVWTYLVQHWKEDCAAADTDFLYDHHDGNDDHDHHGGNDDDDHEGDEEARTSFPICHLLPGLAELRDLLHPVPPQHLTLVITIIFISIIIIVIIIVIIIITITIMIIIITIITIIAIVND